MEWDIAPGQLEEGEELVGRLIPVGVSGEEKAHREAQMYIDNGCTVAGVRYLETIENDLSSDDPGYDPSQNVVGHRWCVIVKVED